MIPLLFMESASQEYRAYEGDEGHAIDVCGRRSLELSVHVHADYASKAY